MAEAVAPLVLGKTTLVSYIAEEIRPAAEFLASMAGVTLETIPAKHAVSFDYLHPLSTPIIRPAPDRMIVHDPIQVSGDVILRYGMLEGDAIIEAHTAVYDPLAQGDSPLY